MPLTSLASWRSTALSSAAAVALCAAGTQSAQAEGGLILIDAPPAQGYTLAVGPALLAYPESPGSSRTKLMAIPGVDFYSSLGGFVSTDNGIGWNFSHRSDFQAGLRLFPIFGRDDDDASRRRLSSIGTRLGKGAFLNYAPWEFLTLQSSLMAGSGRNGNGFEAEAGATLGARIGEATLVGLTLGATWANRAFRDSYFGFTPEDAATSGLPVTSVGAGWQDINMALVGEVPLSKQWKLSGQVNVARLLGAAADSPITTSREQTNVSVTLWYAFH